jgi:hypothetical protein
MSRYAANTEVSSIKSRMEIEQTLTRYGAQQFVYGTSEERAIIGFTMKNRQIKFVLGMPSRNSPVFTTYKRGAMTYRRTESAALEAYEQAVRQRWRALALVVKAKLEAVECGISTFETEFLPHTVLPDGRTVAEVMLPQVALAYERGDMPPLLGYAGAQS